MTDQTWIEIEDNKDEESFADWRNDELDNRCLYCPIPKGKTEEEVCEYFEQFGSLENYQLVSNERKEITGARITYFEKRDALEALFWQEKEYNTAWAIPVTYEFM